MRKDLSEAEENLLQQAREAGLKAHAPYSRFRVGAAVLTDIGIVCGCNVENASFGLCLCAERVALFAAVAGGATRFDMVAVSCIDATGDDVGGRMPCGACRQVMTEFVESTGTILVDGAGAWTLQELLPHAFTLNTR